MAQNNLNNLKRVLLFSELPEFLLNEISAKVQSRSLKKGDTLFNEGDEGNALYIIVSGELEIFRGHASDPNRKILAKLGAGEHFGEMSLLENKPRFATVRALQDCELLCLQSRDFTKLIEENSQLALKLTAGISARLRTMTGVQFSEQISITAADLRKTNIFISYSRRDKEFVQSLHKLTSAAGINTWVDWENIPLTADWWSEIMDGIKNADAVIYIISPDSVASTICQRELVAAIEHNKRIIPILHREIPKDTELPLTIASSNWVSMRSNEELKANINSMLAIVSTDIDWVRQHTRFLNRAMEWKASGRNPNLLMHRSGLDEAEAWLAKSGSIHTSKPLPIHTEYIHASRRESVRRMRATQIIGFAFSLLASIAVLVSGIGFRNANIASREAESARATAVGNANVAATAQAIAEEELKRSEQLRLSLEANEILEDPSGNAETAALLSLTVLRTGYIPQADNALVRALERMFTLQSAAGHTDAVSAIVFSPDGKYLLTGSDDTTARLWDAATGEEILQFVGHTDEVKSVAFSPDGRFVLTGSDDGTARLWDAATGNKVILYTGHTGQITSVSFSHDGKYTLTTSTDGTARVWDQLSASEAAKFVGHTGEVNSAVFSANGEYILTGGEDGTARLWEISTGAEVQIFEGHSREVLSVAISPDGNYILTGSDTNARLFESKTGVLVRQFIGHTDRVRTVAISPNGNYVLTGSSDTTARLWDLTTGLELRRFSGHIDQICGAAFSPDGSQIATASRDTTARIWNAVINSDTGILEDHVGAVLAVAFSPDGQFVITGGEDNIIHLWDSGTDLEFTQLTGHENWVSSVAFSPDGKYILSGSLDTTARIWDLETQTEVVQLLGHTDEITSVSFSPDGTNLLTASADNTARLWNFSTGEEIRQFIGHTASVEYTGFSLDGKHIVTASNDMTVRLWDVNTGKELKLFIGHTDEVKSAAFSPDGEFIISAGDDRTARLWDISTGDEIRQFTRHQDQIKSVAFSPDGKYILTGSDDATALLWDVRTGSVVRAFTIHTAPVKTVAFSSDGNFILTGSVDQTARVWNTEYTQTMSDACRRIYRELTEEDKERYLISSSTTACP